LNGCFGEICCTAIQPSPQLGFIPTKVPNPPQNLRHQADIIDLLVFLAPPFALNLMGAISGDGFLHDIHYRKIGKFHSQNDHFPCSLSQELNPMIS
jgi:hypothetical protein|tara:strand:+ start:110 stop:397 length:288 start_codon:yes stop_codon:yes gene_type:complete